MSHSRAASFARKMQQGTYHRDLFRTEPRQEQIVVRDGHTASSASNHVALGQSMGAVLDAALKLKR